MGVFSAERRIRPVLAARPDFTALVPRLEPSPVADGIALPVCTWKYLGGTDTNAADGHRQLSRPRYQIVIVGSGKTLAGLEEAAALMDGILQDAGWMRLSAVSLPFIGDAGDKRQMVGGIYQLVTAEGD